MRPRLNMALKVLVIDDSPTIRQFVRAALTDANFDVVEAVDGVDGAEKLAENADVAVVICDANMPRLNGIDLCQAIKGDPKHATLPVLMLTTESQPAMIQRAKAAGATGWLIKPIKPELLVATIKKVTRT